ncbi:MAG: DUF4012 domain-containing protein [Anaerolineales bacterium]|nr:DUF4012 domain-containing protein [Anaerolineales bacterium]
MTNESSSDTKSQPTRFIKPTLLAILILALIAVGFKGWHIYQKSMTVYQGVNELRMVARQPVSEMDLEAIEDALTRLQDDLNELNEDVEPFLWLAPSLGWVPVYGGDLSNAPALLEVAEHLVDASVLSLAAARPIWNQIKSQESALDPVSLTRLLVDAQPQLMDAQDELDKAVRARGQIQVEALSPRLQDLMMNDLALVLSLMDDGLALSASLPIILGAEGNEPKGYLLLIQNEDELRPTGGFITSVGRLEIQNGEVISLEIEGVDNETDWSKPYPSAPWQLQEYMNTSVLILRDSNWFADFPTNVRWAEHLYSYNHSRPVDGVVAFDQQFLVMLLGVIGPLEVSGAPYAITDQNAIEYMRTAKEPPADEQVPDGWYRKEFISDLADAVLDKLVGDGNKDWFGLADVVMRALDERHLLLQFDDPTIEALLAKNDWDNALRYSGGDILMTTDTNIGFNKTNALIEVSLAYDLDFSNISSPRGSVTIHHTNNSSSNIECIQFNTEPEPDYYYPMNRCYWSYLRVYKQAGAELVDATPHSIPGDWMLLGRRVPARVDMLDEEMDGVNGYGTLLVVPGGESRGTGFDFSLPASIFDRDEDTGQLTYRLKVKKQPGTASNPLVLRIHLPDRSQVLSVNMEALIHDDNILIETDLRTDVYLELIFLVP